MQRFACLCVCAHYVYLEFSNPEGFSSKRYGFHSLFVLCRRRQRIILLRSFGCDCWLLLQQAQTQNIHTFRDQRIALRTLVCLCSFFSNCKMHPIRMHFTSDLSACKRAYVRFVYHAQVCVFVCVCVCIQMQQRREKKKQITTQVIACFTYVHTQPKPSNRINTGIRDKATSLCGM